MRGSALSILILLTLCLWVAAITFANLAVPESGKNLITEFYRSLLYEKWIETIPFTDVKTIDVKGFESLSVHLSSSQVEVTQAKDGVFKIEVTGEVERKFEGKSWVWYEKKGSLLELRFDSPEVEGSRNILRGKAPPKVKIWMPAMDWKTQWVAEGALTISDVKMKELTVMGGYLRMHLKNVTAPTINLFSKTGRIQLEKLTAEQIKILTQSAPISTTIDKGKRWSLNSEDGDIHVSLDPHLRYEKKLKSGSGAIHEEPAPQSPEDSAPEISLQVTTRTGSIDLSWVALEP